MIISIFITIISFFLINYIVYYVTDRRGLPDWLYYKPFICRTCLQLWVSLFFYINYYLIFNDLYILIVGILLTIMNTIALIIDERNTKSIYNNELEQ